MPFTYTFFNSVRRKTRHICNWRRPITLLSLKSLLRGRHLPQDTLPHRRDESGRKHKNEMCRRKNPPMTRAVPQYDSSEWWRYPLVQPPPLLSYDRRRRRRRFPCRFRTGHFHGHETQERQGERFGVDLPTYLPA